MWKAGARMKVGNHGGIVHEGAIVLQGLGEVIFGSSNWSSSSDNKSGDEHNFFYTPGFNKPWFFQWFDDQFTRKWNDTTNYVDFVPLPPDTPTSPSPADKSSGQSTSSVTLRWQGGPWAHFYDIYFGTSSNPTLLAGNVQIGNPSSDSLESYTVSNLQPGTTYYWKITGKTWAQLGRTGGPWSFTTSGTSGGGGGSTPYGGTPAVIPGTFQAENFDEGGQNVAYYDTTSTNSGGAYRPTTGVDIEATTDSGGGYDVGWTKAGEWMKYTVNVGTTGTYQFQARVANTAAGGNFRVEVDGVAVASLDVPNTGGWQAWQTVTTTGISLTAGQHVIRVVFATQASNGSVGNFNWFQFDTASGGSTSTPYGGTPAPIPGTFQAENFDDGGQNVAYSDTTPTNSGGSYRPTTGVDIEPTTDSGGGYDVGWTKAGEWMKYTVNVTAGGTYQLQTRVANAGSGGSFRVEVDGSDKTGLIAVPNTGGWQNWQTITTTGISLTSGQHVIRVVFTAVSSSGGAGNFNWFSFQ